MKLETKIEFFQDDSHLVSLDSIQCFNDGSGYCAFLTVYSKPFSCVNHQFYFQNLKSFLKEIIKINDSLKGTAGIGPTLDNEHIKFEMKSRGHLTVSGELLHGTELGQSLRFSFDTDQSYLGSLAKSAVKALNELKKR